MYGPQETCPIEEQTAFFEELSIEINNADMLNDNPIVVGDLNAKVEYRSNNISPLSSNGKLLKEVAEENNLNVLNFHPKCMGKVDKIYREERSSRGKRAGLRFSERQHTCVG